MRPGVELAGPESSGSRRTASEITRLCYAGLDSVTLRQRVLKQLARAVPYDAFCCGTIDPLTSLITSEVADGIPAAAFPIAAENEYLEPDVSKFDILASSGPRTAILSDATAGELARSARYQRLVAPFGFGPELRAAFVDRGRCWGGVTLFRHLGQPDFTTSQARFVERVSSHVAAGLRMALIREPRPGGSAKSPGVVVLDDSLHVESLTPEAEQWMDELLSTGNVTTAELPRPVYEVASRVQALAHGREYASPARLRARTASGDWLVVHGSRLADAHGDGAKTAIILEAAGPPEITPLIIQAYGFSPREQDVLEQVLSGVSTGEAAAALAISPYTVGDYLRVIFDRVGVRSQRELLAHFLGERGQIVASASHNTYGDVVRDVAFGRAWKKRE